MSANIQKSVAFINPPTPNFRKITRNVDCASESKGNYLLQPFDFLLLTGAFPASVEIHIIDAVADRLNLEQTLEALKTRPFDLIITSIIDTTWTEDLKFLSCLRERYLNTPILVFGDALIEDQNAREIEKLMDGIITSPLLFNARFLSDFTREEIVQKKSILGLRENGFYLKPKKAPTQKTLFRPRHELFLHENYRWPFASFRRYTTVITTWGCPYSCSYCTSSKLPALYRSPEEIIEELSFVKGLGIKEIYFGDKSFGVPVENTRILLREMIKRDFRFSWSTYFHPNQYSPELLELMKGSGCHTVIIGIESENVASLAKFNRRTKKEKIEELIEHANRIRLNVCGDFLFGLPDEDRQAVNKTLDYAMKLNLDYASFNIASPLPGSVIKALAIQDQRMTSEDHHFDSVGKGRILPSPHLSAAELEAIRNRAVKKFYLRPKYLFKRLTRLRGFEHFMIQLAEMLEIIRKAT